MMTMTMSSPAQASAEGKEANTMAVDPLERADWDDLVAAHPQSTIFHSGGWARVLRDTYGHRPFYMARFEGKRLAGLLPVMEVSSWLTGRRSGASIHGFLSGPQGWRLRRTGPLSEGDGVWKAAPMEKIGVPRL